MEIPMRFAGLAEVATFLAQCPGETEAMRAWVTEVRHRTWANAAALTTDFADVDTSRLPTVVFGLQRGILQIETLIDFRSGIVLLTAIRRRPDRSQNPRSLS